MEMGDARDPRLEPRAKGERGRGDGGKGAGRQGAGRRRACRLREKGPRGRAKGPRPEECEGGRGAGIRFLLLVDRSRALGSESADPRMSRKGERLGARAIDDERKRDRKREGERKEAAVRKRERRRKDGETGDIHKVEKRGLNRESGRNRRLAAESPPRAFEARDDLYGPRKALIEREKKKEKKREVQEECTRTNSKRLAFGRRKREKREGMETAEKRVVSFFEEKREGRSRIKPVNPHPLENQKGRKEREPEFQSAFPLQKGREEREKERTRVQRERGRRLTANGTSLKRHVPGTKRERFSHERSSQRERSERTKGTDRKSERRLPPVPRNESVRGPVRFKRGSRIVKFLKREDSGAGAAGGEAESLGERSRRASAFLLGGSADDWGGRRRDLPVVADQVRVVGDSIGSSESPEARNGKEENSERSRF